VSKLGSQSPSRRRFIKWAIGIGAAATGAILVPNMPDVSKLMTTGQSPSSGRKWVMVIDLERCNGCKACTDACIEEHKVPFAWGNPNHNGYQEWIRVIETSNDPQNAAPYLPMPCLNCQNAPCAKVCPVGATFYNDEGLVVVDNTRCIGCRFCMAACPYDRRYFNWGEPASTPDEQFVKYTPDYPVPHRRGTVEKCNWCSHRVKMGRLPACVDACHREGMNAIYFGDTNEDVITNGEETLVLSQVLAKRGGYRLKEELGTEPSLYYLPPTGRGSI